jgi:regulator of PEP synthase PpsR (kinase-PPPase family)
VESARLRSIRRREGNEKPGESLTELVSNLDLSLAMEVIRAFSTYFQMVNTAEKVHRIRRRREYLQEISPYRGRPGLQHVLDSDYYQRIDAMNFALSSDDGQNGAHLNEADIVLLGVSRTSKTPTCIYLANRGIKAANVPVVPGVPLPPEVFSATRPLIVGLTKDPARLVQVRRNRLRMIAQGSDDTDYTDLESVRQEVSFARKLFNKNGWLVIDVTRRSIEETAATILTHYARYKDRGEDALVGE